MDPPPLYPPATTTTSTTPTSMHLNYPDSVESSPRSHTAEIFNEPLPPVPGAKLRLMCSYGGHIIPRPHDKSLCYVGGDTRMVVVDRHTSLSSLTSRLSRTLLDGRPFSLKYQLPHEDLDSLVSVTTDEDLDNMVEEYDRITSSCSSASAPNSRIRLFIFFTKPETAASMGSLLDDAKSETWFVDALNNTCLISRNLSDSATIDCLVNLDNNHRNHDLEAQLESNSDLQEAMLNEMTIPRVNEIPVVQHELPDSPMVENGSSSSSSPSMSNLPPIRVRVEDSLHKAGIEEQFARMTFAQVLQKQDDGYGGGLMSAAPPPLPTTVAVVGTVASINPAGGSSEHLNRVLSDDDRSDQGTVPVTFRKPPLPLLQTVQHKAVGASSYNLPSPDSVASDTSIASANSFTKPTHHQEQAQVGLGENRSAISPDTRLDISVPITSQIQIQQAQNASYTSLAQFDQQQHLVHNPNSHFIPQAATTPLPMSSYYPVYAPPPPQPIDHQQQYPVYIMPISQTQPYMSMQSNIIGTATTSATVTSNRIAASAAHPPLYPTKAAVATVAKPEMAAGVYRTAVTSTPPLVPAQQQYVGYAPSQSIAVAANYGFEYGKATADQMYYNQIQAASQYQTMNPAAAVALADASNQLPITSNTMHPIGTSQPLN
ncbi:hypothetical protein JCGZ_10701 [Jatropha curcas]|uniref:PB1 domain-containing protein n=1 Tax=Jatropha curcas TaxID=180498 RepID=A0A067KGB9_JATCU|nr:uncharacterized protein LOC105636726 [Jatropha curcas]KDP35167.1 hypothetical protein JCGZ_10701 [Jatropha curcas]